MPITLKGCTKSDVWDIPLDQIQVDPSRNCRVTPVDIQELKESILKNGILQPGVVRLEGKVPILVAGYSRFRALSELAGEYPDIAFTFPAKVVDAPDNLTALKISLEENLRRNALNPMDICSSIWRLISVEGFTVPPTEAAPEGEAPTPVPDIPRIASFFNKSEAWVTTHMKLRSLSAPIQKQVESGLIPGSVAMKLTDLSDEEQGQVIEKAKEVGGTITRDNVVRAKREVQSEEKASGFTARTSKQVKDYFLEVLSSEDPAAFSDPLDKRISTLLITLSKIMLSFLDGKLTDQKMDATLTKLFRGLLEEMPASKMKEWAKDKK